MRNTKLRYQSIIHTIPLFVGIVIFIFSNGRWIIPLAAWIAPVFLLRYVRTHNSFVAVISLFVLILVSTRIMLFGIIPSLPGFLTYLLTLYYAVLWFLPYLIDRWLTTRRKNFLYTLVFPAAAVSGEFVNNIFFGSWAATAYSQYDHLVLIQMSSIFGIWGLSFLVMWFGSVINWAYENGFERKAVEKGLALYGGVLIFCLLYGGLRLGVLPPTSTTVTIESFTATPEIAEYSNYLRESSYSSTVAMAREDRDSLSSILQKTHRQIFAHNESNLNANTFIFLWAEGMISVLEEDEEIFIQMGSDLAVRRNIYLLLAYIMIPKEDPGRLAENKSVFINPAGQLEWEYLKTHPVPGSTNKPGDGILKTTDTPFGQISAAICYDMDFTQLIGKASHGNTDIMLVPAWDWKAIDPLHARMAVFRAIENGFSMVRQTGEGLSIAVDYQGRVLSSMSHFTADDHQMSANVPVKGINTIYGFIGDSFAWLCLIFLMLMLMLNFRSKTNSSVSVE